MTTLLPIRDAYSTVWVATFEPIFVEWLSGLTINRLRADLINRMASPRSQAEINPAGGASAPTVAKFRFHPPAKSVAQDPRILPVIVHAATVPSLSAAAATPNLVEPGEAGLSGAALVAMTDQDRGVRKQAIDDILSTPQLTLPILLAKLKAANVPFLSGPRTHHLLSPIGVAHLYRQLYFDGGAGVGPIEQVFAVAPKETLEVVQEMTRRTSTERIEAFGSETTQQNQVEQTNQDEISDQVHSSITRDMSVGISASADGTVGVWSASASANVDLSLSTEQSRDQTKRQLRSVTKKSAEIIRKSYSLSIRTFTEFTQRSTIKRTITNAGETPVDYALRRVMRTIRVKVQSVGPRLVWHLYVCRPGEGLAQSRMVMFREAQPITTPGLPPNAPPRPEGGGETGSQTVDILTGHNPPTISVAVPTDAAKNVTAMVIDSIVDAQPGGKDSSPPGITPAVYQRTIEGGLVRFTFSVAPGSANRVSVNYTTHFEPSSAALAQWQQQVNAARAAYDDEKLEAQFERAKRVIEAKSQVASRPATDLRDEERYEILNRMISEAFGTAPTSGMPGPVEIEDFHRFFDIGAMFYYVHPSWWKPRYSRVRDEYEISEDSEPAAFGKSLGWVMQLDGDRRRNEFLNSPWVRVCLPIRPGLERDACSWLADHIEGSRGFTPVSTSSLGKLLTDIESRRAAENAAQPGPDYVTLDGQVAPTETAAAAAYPIIDEFDVVVPTEGFVFDTLSVTSG